MSKLISLIIMQMTLRQFINIERLIHSLKTCTASILAFALTRVISFPADQWVVITVIVVMCAQIYVGSVIQKSYLRFLGTLTGCLLASLMLILYGHTTLSIAVTIGIAAFIFSYIATSQENLIYAGTLGAVTTTIIMLGDNPTITFAAERFLEISIGIFIAAMVSQFFLPIHARTHLRRAQADTLTKLRDYYEIVMCCDDDIENPFNYQDLDEDIVKTLIKQRQLAKESKREPLAQAFDPYHFTRTLYLERELLRAITFMHTALAHVQKAKKVFMRSENVKTFNRAVLKNMDTLKLAASSEKPIQDTVNIPSLHSIQDDLQHAIDTPTREEIIYIDGLLFSAEIVLSSMRKLAELYGVEVKSN